MKVSKDGGKRTEEKIEKQKNVTKTIRKQDKNNRCAASFLKV